MIEKVFTLMNKMQIADLSINFSQPLVTINLNILHYLLFINFTFNRLFQRFGMANSITRYQRVKLSLEQEFSN